jgi:hypothetical protein
MMARFKIVDKRWLQYLEAERISDAQRSTIRNTTLMTLTSDTPSVANRLITEVELRTLVVLIIDNMDDSMLVNPQSLNSSLTLYE